MAIDEQGLKKVNGYWFPETDTECSAVIFHETGKLSHLSGILIPGGTAVQAGGNVGVFPMAMRDMFKHIHTFEPHPDNFRCMLLNCGGQENIHMYHAALGEQYGVCGVRQNPKESPDNCGTYQVVEDSDDMDLNIPILNVDALELPECDLIYLDIEGYEDLALRGAYDTIMEHRPVIVCENKGHNERFPAPHLAPSQEFRAWLCETFEYRLWNRLMRDDVFVCSK